MKPEDVPDEWVERAIVAWRREAERDKTTVVCARHALAAVLPLAVAEEREACAETVDAHADSLDKAGEEIHAAGVQDVHLFGRVGYQLRATAVRDAVTAIRARGNP